MFGINCVLLTFIFLFTVHCNNPSTGNLAQDFQNINITCQEGDDFLRCMKTVFSRDSPTEVKELALSFLNDKIKIYTNKIKLDLKYNNVVNNAFAELIDNESIENVINSNVIEQIHNTVSYQQFKNQTKETYKNDIDDLINEGLQLAKDTIYYDDTMFYDFYYKNLSSLVNKTKELFYDEQIEKIFPNSFEEAYSNDTLEKLLSEAHIEFKTVVQDEKGCSFENTNANSLKKFLFPWAPFLSINFNSNTNQSDNYSFLTNAENVELQLYINDSDKCSTQMKQKMYDNENKILNFTVDKSCLNNIKNDTTVGFVVIEKNKGFTKYNCRYEFPNINFTFYKTINNNNSRFELENDKYIIPHVLNGTFFEYSFDQNDFEYRTGDNNNSVLREYGSNDLKLIIYDEDNLAFASENCIYSSDSSNKTLENDWNDGLSKISNIILDENYPSNIAKILPDHLKEVARSFYQTKKNYLKKVVKTNIEVDLKDEIETKINEQIERKLKTQTSLDNCKNDINQEEILTGISDSIRNMHIGEVDNIIEEGKTEVKTKVYFNDSNFDSFYEKEVSSIIKEFGPKIVEFEMESEINSTLNTCITSGVYESFIEQQCTNAKEIAETIKNPTKYNEVTNISCFTFIKKDLFEWALTLALEIKQEHKNEEPCLLSTDTVFFLTTSLENSESNLVQCELQMQNNMLHDNILFFNFKDGNCDYFPSQLNNIYYLGTKVQLKNILSYQKQFVFQEELNYYKSPLIDNTANIIKNYKETTNNCFLPKQIEFTESFAQNIPNLENTFIEYSIDGKNFNFEKKELIHKMPFENSDTTSVIIYNNETIFFAAHNCEYSGELTCNDCKNHKECKQDNQNIICVCNDGFYGETCEERTNSETMETEINEKLYDILKDDNFIVDIDKNVASINPNKVKPMKSLIQLMRESIKKKDNDTKGIANITQINTLNSITENYLTNAKYDKNSIYLLGLALNGNIMKLHQKRHHSMRKLQDITESEEMIKHKIGHLLHLGAVHAASKDITNSDESDLELIEGNIYIHQWTNNSVTSALEKVNKYNLSSFENMAFKCGDFKSNFQYTLTEIPKELSQEIYEDDQTSNIISFNVKDIDNPVSLLNCPSLKFKIPSKGMNLASNYKIDGKHTINLYEFNSTAFVDKCYRGDFDFDLTKKIKNDIVKNNAIKMITPMSKNCYATNYDESNEKVMLQCSSEVTDLMIAFKVEDFSSKIESGSIFECSTDIDHIEKNIGFWIYFVVTLLTLIGIIFYLSVKYSEKQNSIMRINKAIDNDGLHERPFSHQQEPETERKIGFEQNGGVLNSENIEINQKDIKVEIQEPYGSILGKNFLELHPLINPFVPSLITPLSIRLAFFSFNFLNLFGFNAVFSTNDYLFDRYKTKDRDKFIFPMRDHFDKMISAIVCTMGVAVLMRAIIMVTYGRRENLSRNIQNKSLDRNDVVAEFRKEMVIRRSVCGFIMLIITIWFFYFSIAWCNRYPKAQHSLGDAYAWCLMFNYILFSTVYIFIISAVQTNPKCAKCAYYMKRTFMF